MRASGSLLGALIGAASVIATASCVLVTGGSDGYTLVVSEGGASADAGGGLTLGCLSASDCPTDAGPPICCLVVTSTNAAATGCQIGSCTGTFAAQICATDPECGDASCSAQQCTFAGGTFTVRACGALPTCTPR